VPAVLDDNAVELAPLGRVGPAFVLDERHRRAADGGEQGAQLVAHHAEKLRPQPLKLLEWRKDLQGDTTDSTSLPPERMGVALTSGKTTMLRRARSLLERKGYTVWGLAPSASAAQSLSTVAGIGSETLQCFLVRNSGVAAGRMTRKGEREMRAGFAKTALAVSTRARSPRPCIADALRIPRVVLIGDGKPFAQLQRAGMSTAVMDEIMRQCDPALKEAVEASLAGDVACAFDKFGGNIEAVKSDNLAGAAAARLLALSPEARANARLMTLRWNLTVRAK